jgi:NAD(P)-dependent dehydrogenase (short-subunit alcohol dehydrogenase family)
MKIVIVGATGTIGKEVSRSFDNEHEVIRVGSKSGDIQADIQSPESIERLFDQIQEFDALICTAGNGHFGPLSNMTDREFRKGINSKLLGQVNLLLIGQHYVNPNGSFTLTSGIVWEEPILNAANLSAVNGAINSFAIAAAIELKNNARINVVCPSICENSPEMFDLFPGYEKVTTDRIVNGYRKSVLGPFTGKIIRIY